MSVIVVFQKNAAPLSLVEISETLEGLLGLPVTLAKDGEPVPLAEVPGRDQPLREGTLWVELPELEEDEGQPILEYSVVPRAERDASIAELVGQMVSQEPALAATVNKNAVDVLIAFEGTAASVEAGCAVAYAVAAAGDSGVLLIDSPEEGEFEEDEEAGDDEDGEGETVWFPDAESFADFVFSDDEDGEE